MPEHNLRPFHRYACFWIKRTCSSSSNAVQPQQQLVDSRLRHRILLPQHGQNGTLLLRSTSKSIGQIDIIPQWRDDTLLELMPIREDDSDRTRNGDDHSNSVVEVQYDDAQSSSSETQTISYEGLQLTLHRDGIATALGRKGSLVEVDVDVSTDDNCSINTSEDANDDAPLSWKLVATVPEKSNVTCKVAKGNINVMSKLEGDTHLVTADGDIRVSKLRGHDVTLNNSGLDDDTIAPSCSTGLIYVQKGIEAQRVRISSSNRVRARMVNGSDVSVQVAGSTKFAEQITNNAVIEQNSKLDEDDAGYRIDIGSLYISGSSECEARLDVEELDSSTGLVRIKSSHGHVVVNARTKQNEAFAADAALVDFGGVNGSCDVNLEVKSSSPTQKPACEGEEAPVMARVHFDSLSPDSISTIKSSHVGRNNREGVVSVTADRKVEAEIRLLALGNGSESMSIDMDLLTSDEPNDVASALLRIGEQMPKIVFDGTDKTAESISIETESFEPLKENSKIPDGCFEYKQGTIRNRSGEPDSRFDIRSSPSRGKINIDSAASQALSGFQGMKNDSSDNTTHNDNSHLPLLAVVTDGKIKLETLSWLGSIARRYGLEGTQELGRTATRRPRLN